MSVSFIPKEDRLDLSFDGNLDLTVANDLCELIPRIDDNLKTCIVDLSRVERVFDSGIALLRMLSGGLARVGATLVVLSDHPDVQRRMPLFLGNASCLSPQDAQATLRSA